MSSLTFLLPNPTKKMLELLYHMMYHHGNLRFYCPVLQLTDAVNLWNNSKFIVAEPNVSVLNKIWIGH